MKKYIVKYKKDDKFFDEYKSYDEALKDLLKFISRYNTICNFNNYLTPFDFKIEEVEVEVNRLITDFKSACNYLLKDVNKKFCEINSETERMSEFIRSINPNHLETLIALNELFTIADAQNKADGFVPDFSDDNQCKYFPWFAYNNYAAGFVSESASYTLTTADACIGSRLCFKTKERAAQFGKQFADLYNKVFLP